ncbi:MAG: restriction endonuclease subunit S [Thermoguttaceae bacterium]|nr:restriction endonuclease subunit S [Thermoguttaceae bacterium]
MAKVKFGDVVREVKVNIDRRNDDHEFFIAGEHMESNNIHITQKGRFSESDVGPAFIRLFKPGQILYGSRRTYLRKVAVADFEGITSNTTFVLESKDRSVLMQELLPFIMLTDEFTQYAVRNSKGSTNPYILFSDLAAYEFNLPSLEEQRHLVGLLQACDRVQEAYKTLISRTDDLVKSQFFEMFGDPVENEKSWPTYRFSEVATSRLGKMLDKGKQTGNNQRKYLANANVQWFSFNLQNLNQMDFDEGDRKEFQLLDGDLLVCEGGEIGRCAVWHAELTDCYFQKAIHRVRCNTNMLLPEYLGYSFYYHSQKNGFVDIVSSKSTIAHLTGDKLKEMRIIVPPMELQKRFVIFVNQIAKSKFAAQQALKELTDAQSALMKKIFE